MKTHPTLADVERTAALPDAAFRNLLITWHYYELSAALTERLGARANWCTFATWASKQAGQTIRGEDLRRGLEQVSHADPEALEALLALVRDKGAGADGEGPRQLIREQLGLEAAAARASEAVGRGNRKVYAEIAREFARFLDACAGDAAFDAGSIDTFCAALRPGPPPDGQQYLQQAFRAYYRAFFETDAKTRAELTLLANLLIGFHEQTRLQPEIRAALDASMPEPGPFARALLGALFPYRGWLYYLGFLGLRLLGRTARLDAAIQQLYTAIRQRIRRLLTEHLMTIGFAQGQRLRLGQDLRAGFPELLQRIEHPELLALLAQIDPSPDNLRDSGASDWADLADRIHFIADMFRCYQEKTDLLEAPFSAEQVAEMKAERMPAGAL